MIKNIFNYQTGDNTIVFTDTLKTGSPYIAKLPRDHESIFFVTKGSLLYEKEDTKNIIEKGQIGYIQKGSIDKSSAYLCDEVSYIAINFGFDCDFSVLPFKCLCSQGNLYEYEKLFQWALNCFDEKTPGYMTICNGITLQIIGYLYNEYKLDVGRLQKMQRIENAVDYIKKHYNDADFRISILADHVNMSEKHFRRIFLDVYKKTPYTFLQEFRISKAEILLLNTSKKISDIAFQCGFCDVYSFSHCFKKHVGRSPSKYRSSRI